MQTAENSEFTLAEMLFQMPVSFFKQFSQNFLTKMCPVGSS